MIGLSLVGISRSRSFESNPLLVCGEKPTAPISFLLTLGPEVVSHAWVGIGNDTVSNSHISVDGSHAGH
jgi:hypothetical protein